MKFHSNVDGSYWKENSLTYVMTSNYAYDCDSVMKKQSVEINFVCKSGSKDRIQSAERFWDYCDMFDGKEFGREGFGKTVVEISTSAACF